MMAQNRSATSVDTLSMSHLDNCNDQFFVQHLINDSVYPLPNAVAFLSGEFFTSFRAWVFLQRLYALKNTFNIFVGNGSKILGNRFFKNKPIFCHEL